MLKFTMMLKDQLEDDLATDLSDDEVTMAGDLVDFCKAMEALCGNPFSYLNSYDLVDKLRKQSKSIGEKPLTLLGGAVVASSFFQERLTNYVQMCCKWKVHAKKIESIDEFLAKPRPLMLSVDLMKEYLHIMKSMVYSQEEIDIEVLGEWVKRVWAAWLELWKLVSAFEVLKADELDCLMELLKETQLAYPSQTSLHEHEVALKSFLQRKTGQEKIEVMVQNFVQLEEEWAKGSEVMETGVLQMLKSIKEAEGVKLVGELDDKMKKTLERVSGALANHFQKPKENMNGNFLD